MAVLCRQAFAPGPVQRVEANQQNPLLLNTPIKGLAVDDESWDWQMLARLRIALGASWGIFPNGLDWNRDFASSFS